MNSICFLLSEVIDPNKFLNKVQNLIHKQQSLHNKILKIQIVEITHETNDLIPKLEYKNNTELNSNI